MDSGVLGQCLKRGHEQVTYFYYPEVGLKAVVSIHSTVLGPSLGGCRMRVYQDEAQALDDVMRLAEGMTYKSALAGMNLGGGKACIIVDPTLTIDRERLFSKFGECVQSLGGRYITAEDMGTSVTDMVVIAQHTRFVTGADARHGGSGDPSPWTAQGVFSAIRAACEYRYGSGDLTGKRITVQGVGHVGMYLVGHLTKAGAKVTVCDTNHAALEEAKKTFGVSVVPTDSIYDVACDIFAPCAIGQTVNAQTLPRLKCEIIAGAANNQLSDPDVYTLLGQRGILYCPDFAINSGGVISVGAEINPGGWNESWVREMVGRIHATTTRVLQTARERGKFTELVAVELAKERIDAARRERSKARQ